MQLSTTTLAALLFTICTLLFSGCKKEGNANHPFKDFVGTYSVTYHERQIVPGAPQNSGVCDSTYAMTVTLDYVEGDDTKLKCTLESSKLHCQPQNLEYWCLSATKNSDGQVTGSNFAEVCGDQPPIVVTGGTLSITGNTISCNVNYNYIVNNTGPTLPTLFEFTGTKN